MPAVSTPPEPQPDAGVRTARAEDAESVGAVHAASWLGDYAALLPQRAASVDAAALGAAWLAAVTDPPSPQHRVMVATAGPTVVGFVAFGPSADGDTEPGADAELVALLVEPTRQRRGHGSRLLSASVEMLRENNFSRVHSWVPEPDQPRLAFLEAAGFARDGAARVLDAAGDGTTTVREVRLSAGITPER